MWKWKEEDKQVAPARPEPAPVAAASANQPKVTPKEVRAVETSKPLDTYRADVAHIGKSVIVKGELSGSEDLYLDGEVEGTIELRGHSLIIGPNGRVRASIHARDIVVHGKVDGNVHAVDRVELKKSAVLVGDIFTQRIAIEDGAYFKGGIDIQKQAPKEAHHEVRREPVLVASSAGAGASAAAASAAAPAPQQSSLLETTKK